MVNNKKGYSLAWSELKKDWPLWLWMAGLVVAGFLLYPILPDRVPSHWNFQGEIDDYSSRGFGAFFPPLLCIGIYLLLLVTPLIDPKRENYSYFSGAYRFLRWGLVLFFTFLYAATIFAALGYPVDVGMIVKALVALLFIVIGNFMGQIRHNYFVGIKTPWTLANEEVWQRTHRMGGKLWVVAGIGSLFLAPIHTSWSAWLFFALIMVAAFIPIVYSYLLFRKDL